MLDLFDLHVFRSVVQHGGVNRAAEQLHRVPSNISTRIRKLEEDLGTTLFLRDGGRMQLSSAGKILHDYADRLLALSEEARNALHVIRLRGTFRLGCMESTAAVRLPEPLCIFHERYPEVSLELQIGDPEQLTAQVLAGELDAALVVGDFSASGLEAMQICKEELVIVAQAGHPMIASAKDVKKRTLVTFRPGCPYRKRLEDWFARGGKKPERVVELQSYHAILGCIAADMGVALMPRSVIDIYTERSWLSTHPLSPKFRTSRTVLVWRKKTSQPMIGAFADILCAALQ